MITGTTSSGFAFEVSENIVDDAELLVALCDLDEGKLIALAKVFRKILGSQMQAMFDHIREPDGRVPMEKAEAEVMEIFAAVKDGKKS